MSVANVQSQSDSHPYICIQNEKNPPQSNAGLRGVLYNGQKQQNRHELFVRAGFACTCV